MQQISSLNLSHIDLSESDNLAGETTKLMMFFNLSNPLWTYDTLIFPTFNALIPDSFLGSNGTFEGVSISVRLPALRPSLECTIAPAGSTNNAYSIYTSEDVSEDASGYASDSISTHTDLSSGVYSTQQTFFPLPLGTSNATLRDRLDPADFNTTYVLPNDTQTSVPMTPVGLASSV